MAKTRAATPNGENCERRGKMGRVAHYAKRTVTFQPSDSDGTTHTINAADLSREIVGDIVLLEPNDIVVLHPDGSGEIIRPGATPAPD